MASPIGTGAAAQTPELRAAEIDKRLIPLFEDIMCKEGNLAIETKDMFNNMHACLRERSITYRKYQESHPKIEEYLSTFFRVNLDRFSKMEEEAQRKRILDSNPKNIFLTISGKPLDHGPLIKAYLEDLDSTSENRMEKLQAKERLISEQYVQSLREMHREIRACAPMVSSKNLTDAHKQLENRISAYEEAVKQSHHLVQTGREIVDLLHPELRKAEADDWLAGCAQPVKSRSTPQRSGKKKKGRGSRGSKKQRKPQAQEASAAAALPRKKTEALFEAYTDFLLKQTPNFTEAQRVKRWRTNNVVKIQKFRDRQGDRVIQRYASHYFTEDKLIKTRMYHLAGLGLEKIISNDEDRAIYSFDTSTGVGVLAQIVIDRVVKNGIIYFGINKEQVIYHRFFEKLKQGDKAEQLIQRTDIQPSELEEEEETPTLDVSFKVRENGIIELNYSGVNFALFVHPLRSDLLPSRLEAFQN